MRQELERRRASWNWPFTREVFARVLATDDFRPCSIVGRADPPERRDPRRLAIGRSIEFGDGLSATHVGLYGGERKDRLAAAKGLERAGYSSVGKDPGWWRRSLVGSRHLASELGFLGALADLDVGAWPVRGTLPFPIYRRRRLSSWRQALNSIWTCRIRWGELSLSVAARQRVSVRTTREVLVVVAGVIFSEPRRGKPSSYLWVSVAGPRGPLPEGRDASTQAMVAALGYGRPFLVKAGVSGKLALKACRGALREVVETLARGERG